MGGGSPEASAARASHIEVDYTRHTVTWLLPASKRDPYAAWEARTHWCWCRNGVRHPACPYHIFLEYFEVLKQRFGHDFASPDRNLPLFPSVNGSTLLKRDVVAPGCHCQSGYSDYQNGWARSDPGEVWRTCVHGHRCNLAFSNS